MRRHKGQDYPFKKLNIDMTKSPQDLNQLKDECYQLIDKIAASRFCDRLLPAAKRFLQIYATGVPSSQEDDKPKYQPTHRSIDPFPKNTDLLRYLEFAEISVERYLAMRDEPLIQLYRDCSRWLQEHDGLS